MADRVVMAVDVGTGSARAGRRAELVPGDIAGRRHRTGIVGRAVSGFGRLDILVNDAAVFQRTCERTDDITAGEWDRIFRVNVHAMFYLSQAAVPHMRPGAAIVNATSVQAKDSPPQLLAYAATKGAISTLTATPARMPAGRAIRVNAVAPGPIWTPPIPSTMPAEKAAGFGQQAPRAGQPKEPAPGFVPLASDGASYISGAVVPVTGRQPML